MERTDSSTAMASLVAMYEERSDDEEKKGDVSPSIASATVDDISDDEGETRNSSSPSTHSQPPSRPSSRPFLVDDNSVSSTPDVPPLKRNTSLSRSVLNKSSDEIELPPEPSGKCPRPLQEKIAKLYEKKRNMNQTWDLNDSIKRRKDFRNPSIYEKLIEFIGIDEKGTNYPPEIYDPHSWGKESFYDALDKAQKAEMEKREKERKDRTKMSYLFNTDEKKRKSKWDSQVPVGALTSSATGTKSTVIPATGSISKKPK
ncbi:hypothetical protein FSP39_004518 [Pinctada imbricata]|uniref:SAP30-binding protein n=1 Tax=Pinctada imbricata TaxID=66713 RepID=A0AA88YBD4_PINIB|nr:hypothetical protein FSP39_004518 [Pinctada imbricata]